MKFVSACLLGVKCRYDGKSKPNKRVLNLLEKETLIPVCPEQLGGLTTPREPSEQRDGTKKVFTKSGEDVSEEFQRGAKQTLRLMNEYGVKEIILKSKSPSCGCGTIYDGTFSGKLVEGDGVTAQVLKENGIKVFTEEDI